MILELEEKFLENLRLAKEREDIRIEELNLASSFGFEISKYRTGFYEKIIISVFREVCKNFDGFVLLAVGGFGRKDLNPRSDIDFLIVTRDKKIELKYKEIVEKGLYLLWGLNFKLGYAVRTLSDALDFANSDFSAKTSLLEMRFVLGDKEFFEFFARSFQERCVFGMEEEIIRKCQGYLDIRFKKYAGTVFLQEPNVKESPGGLRDFHNLRWISRIKYGSGRVTKLLIAELLSDSSYVRVHESYDFLLRLRSEMHYLNKSSNDNLYLNIQGKIADRLRYPQKDILRRIEGLMRDYYISANNLYLANQSVMERLRIKAKSKVNKIYNLDNFIIRDGVIFPKHGGIFISEPILMMRLFLYSQLRSLKISPQVYRLLQKNSFLVDRHFRKNKKVREVFEMILSNKGRVGGILRKMHRVGFLGNYIPEFDRLTCLVQHEFFHQYSADEHTLKCLDVLDSLNSSKKESVFYNIYKNLKEIDELCYAILLHDTGRSCNSNDHSQSSAVLANKLCNRMDVKNERRHLVLFLVDHHLTFWKYATTKNINDPHVIEEFCGIVKTQRKLNMLLLFTFVDSNATNDRAWDSWKETLILQLYRVSSVYFSDRQVHLELIDYEKQRDEILSKTSKKVREISVKEIEKHFFMMPKRYFYMLEESDAILHLKLAHKMLKNVMSERRSIFLKPIIFWKDKKNLSISELVVVGWDRKFLLAYISGYLAKLGINILSGEFYRRKDYIVLDTFKVNKNFDIVFSKSLKDRFNENLINSLLSAESALDISIPKRVNIMTDVVINPSLYDGFPRKVLIDNEKSDDFTLVEIQTIDRIGLLYEIFSVLGLGKFNIEISNARISTENGAVFNSFDIHDTKNEKIRDTKVLSKLQSELRNVI